MNINSCVITEPEKRLTARELIKMFEVKILN